MKVLSTISTINLEIPPSNVAYLLKECNYLCFLDSSLYPNKYSKFSYIAWDPKFVIKSFGYRNEFINIHKGVKYYSYQHPMVFLKLNINNYICSCSEGVKNNIKTLFIGRNKVKEVTNSKSYSFDEENNDLKKNSLISSKLPDFRGGFIGYLSYDLKNYIESLPQSALNDTNLPIFYFAYYDKLISYSHDEGKWYFIRNFSFIALV